MSSGFTNEEIDRLRAETPGCESIVHFNNAGAALICSAVLDVQTAHLHREAKFGAYEAAREAEPQIRQVYEEIAALIGCSSQEIALAPNATWAWSQGFLSIPLKKGDEILTAESEFASNYMAYLKRAKETGVSVRVIPNDIHGQIDTRALLASISKRVKLISLPHIPTNSGLINPVSEVGQIARQHGILFLLDACQSIGQVTVDVNELGCDMLAATSRKFLRGPRGVGFLYVKKRLIESLEPPVIDPRGSEWITPNHYRLEPDARRFETWEYSVAGALAFGEAVRRARLLGMERVGRRIRLLAQDLRTKLTTYSQAQVRDSGIDKGGIVTFDIAGLESQIVMNELINRGFNVNITKPAFTLLDMQRRRLPDLVRASLHYYNTEQEIDAFCGAVSELTPGSRSESPRVT